MRLPTQRKLLHVVIAIDWVIGRSPYPRRRLAKSQLPSVARAMVSWWGWWLIVRSGHGEPCIDAQLGLRPWLKASRACVIGSLKRAERDPALGLSSGKRRALHAECREGDCTMTHARRKGF